MPQIIPIYIPNYISDQNYNPTRVLPRLFFYNGLVECETYYIQSGSLTTSGVKFAQDAFPYFDNYNVVTGSFPTTESDSLLFNNEAVSYGQIPISNLYTEYWETYVNLLYNPKTRLFNCEAIIPLADYYKMELNDIVEWRGNYYHLRAINEYNLKNGECKIQLLGPLEPPVISNLLPEKDCGFSFSSSAVLNYGVATSYNCENCEYVTYFNYQSAFIPTIGKFYKTNLDSFSYQIVSVGGGAIPGGELINIEYDSCALACDTTSSINYGVATSYDCPNCDNVSIAINYKSTFIPTIGKFYRSSENSKTYEIFSVGGPAIPAPELINIEYASCSLSCATTTTTTTTIAPTTTTTSTTSTTTSTTSTTTTAAYVEYQIDSAATGTSAGACSGATTTTIVYASPGNTVPFVGMFLYTNTGLTTPFVGSTGWRKLTGPLDTYAVEINTSGEITNYVTC